MMLNLSWCHGGQDLERGCAGASRSCVGHVRTGTRSMSRLVPSAVADNNDGSIDVPVEDGDTLLHLACLYGHLPCVQLLLERGASLECKDEGIQYPNQNGVRNIVFPVTMTAYNYYEAPPFPNHVSYTHAPASLNSEEVGCDKEVYIMRWNGI